MRLTLVTGGVCALALAVILPVGVLAPLRSDVLVPVAVFGLLLLLAENLELVVRSEVDLSGGVMILIAATIVFRRHNEPLGPMLVGMFVAGYLPQLRTRQWIKLAFNSATFVLATFAAAIVFWLLPDGLHQPIPVLILVTGLSASVYLLVNSTLVSLPVALACGEPYRKVLRQLVRFDGGAYPFALLGLGLGWAYLELGAAVVPLLVVPILIARGAFASYLELRAAQEQAIETLIHTLEAKDPYTAGHAQRVANFAEYVGTEFTFGPKRLERLRYAALMHDIGKLIVPNQLLNKPGRLTEAEFARVRRHEGVSVELLGRIDFLAPVAPNTTTEAASRAVDDVDEVVEPAIIMVADAFDAMTSTRAYRRALSQETAFAELRAKVGTQFRGDCVEALVTAIERRGERYGAGHEIDQHDWAVAPPDAGTGSAGLGDLVPEERAGT
jgi:hypothetical protein